MAFTLFPHDCLLLYSFMYFKLSFYDFLDVKLVGTVVEQDAAGEEEYQE